MIGRGMYISNLNVKKTEYHEDLFFRDGARVPLSFYVKEFSKDGTSAVMVSPRGKTPRAYTAGRLEVLRLQDEKKHQEKLLEKERKLREAVQHYSDNLEGFKLALVQARLITASGGKSNAKDIPALADMRQTLSSLVNNDFWSDKSAQYLVSLVGKYNALAARMRVQVATENEIRDNPANWLRSGKVEISGTVKSVKDKETMYGWQRKMLVQLDTGAKVWGSIPKAFRNDVKAGDRVEFTATVTPSAEDKIFGFFSRPSKFSHFPNKDDQNDQSSSQEGA